MAASAVASVRHLVEEYRRYLRTSYHFLDPDLMAQFDRHLKDTAPVVKGPYITLAREFKRGETLTELIQKGKAAAGLAKAAWAFGEDRLYVHQQRALELGRTKNFLVTTGTGSGKTEAFLLPILDGLIQSKATQQKGVKAILLYPMNALANDQLKRLRELLTPAMGLRFGMYTGESDRVVASMRDQADGQTHSMEVVTHASMRQNPPDILLTNFKQLEFLLVRKQDRVLFSSNLSYLVLDELHSYRGAMATEMACLLRRLRALSSLAPGQLRCIGTSATVASAGGQEALANFASQLFGEPFQADAVFGEEIEDLPPFQPQPVPSKPTLEEKDLDGVNLDEIALAEKLATKLLGRQLPDGKDLPSRISAALEGNALLRAMEEQLVEGPASVDEIARSWSEFVAERVGTSLESLRLEVTTYLLLASLGDEDHPPRLRPKLHSFFHGVYEFHLCTNPSHRALLAHGQDRCDCGAVARPVALCRTCGQDFFKVRFDDVDPSLTIGTGEFRSSEYTAHLTHGLQSAAFASDGTEEDEPIEEEEPVDPVPSTKRKSAKKKGLNEAWLCPGCGRVADVGGPCDECNTPRVKILMQRGPMHKCPVCNSINQRQDIVTPLRTGTASSVAVLIERHLDLLDANDRRLLVFADNRQDAAHQAGYTEDKHRAFILKHLVLDEAQKKGKLGISLRGLPQSLLDRFKELGIIEFDPGRDERDNWLQAFALDTAYEISSRSRSRLSLESLGLLWVDVEPEKLQALGRDPAFIKWTEQAKISVPMGLQVVSAIVMLMRQKRAIDFDFFQQYINPNREAKYRALEHEPYNFRYNDRELRPQAFILDRPDALKKKASSLFHGFFQENKKAGKLTAVEKLLGKVCQNLTRDAGADLVKSLIPILGRDDVRIITRTSSRFPWPRELAELRKPAWQINKDYLILSALENPKRCPKCRTWAPSHWDICPRTSCESVQLGEGKVDEKNYYVQVYGRQKPGRLVVREHSAQIDDEERSVRENLFKKGRVNVLVATPTLEMGVDIGSLLTAVMRKAPPTPANYAQRVGRAGRRLRIGFVSTFCAGGPHDQHVFQNPAWLVAGRFQPPRLRLDNPKIVARHLRSHLLENLQADLPDYLKDLLDNTEEPTTWDQSAIQAVAQETVRRRDDLTGHLVKLFEDDRRQGRAERYEQAFCQNVVEGFGKELTFIFEAWWKRVKEINEEFHQFSKIGGSSQDERRARARKRAFRELTDDRHRAYVLGYLSTKDFLPAYQFPQDTFTLDPGVTDTKTLTRPAGRAIEEFAPGNYVYANGHKLKSIRVLYSGGGKDPVGNAASNAEGTGRLIGYAYCDHCGEAVDEVLNQCPRCAQPLPAVSEVLFVDAFEAEENLRIGSDEENRERRFFDRRENLVAKHDGESVLFDYPFAALELRRQAEILVTNWGPMQAKEGEGTRFKLCPECGRHEPNGEEWKKKKDGTVELVLTAGLKAWRDSHARFCQGNARPMALGHRFQTDALILRVPTWSDLLTRGKYKYGRSAVTLAEALTSGASQILELENQEISAFVRRHREDSNFDEIILYENVAGGAGYLEEMAQRLPEVAAAAMERLYGHECPGACYQCLKSFYNQPWHNFYDKYGIADYLGILAGHDKVAPEIVRTEQVESKVMASLGKLREESVNQGRQPGVKGPQSPIEVKLLEAMRQITELSDVVLQHEVVDPKSHALLTVPDFVFGPDKEKVAVFCDGFAYHGGRETLEGDAFKRNRLQELGWVVLVFWGRQVGKDPLRCAKQVEGIVRARRVKIFS